MKYLPGCTRVEVIDSEGRSYTNWDSSIQVHFDLQDDGRTLKIFIYDKKKNKNGSSKVPPS